MKKRKKKNHQHEQDQTSAAPESQEPIEQMLAELLSGEEEMDADGDPEAEEFAAADAEQPLMETVEPLMEQGSPPRPHRVDPEWVELAAALAEFELSELAEQEQAAGKEASGEMGAAGSEMEPDCLDAIPEPMEAEWELLAEAPAEDASLIEQIPAPEATQWAEPVSGQVDQFTTACGTEPFSSGGEMPGQMLAEPAGMSGPEPETAPESLIEDPVVPLPPQPPLESVLAGIDEELEKSPALAAAGPGTASVAKHITQLDDYVVFNLAGADYAVPVRDIAEIGRVPSITRVPNVPDFIRGITNLRGEMMPVLSLCGLLGLQEAPPSPRGRVLFLRASEQVPATGLLVDEMKGIQRIQSQQLEQVTGLIDDKVTSVLRGVHGRGDRLLNILDVGQLFQLQEFRQLGVS